MLVDPTRSQNMTVIGRRSAVAGDDAGAGLGGLAVVSPVPRAAIALSRRLRCPNGTPIFSRSASTRSRRTPASISCSQNTVSYCPRSIAFSHWATFIVVPAHGSTLMMVPGRLRVQAGSVGRPLWGRLDPFAPSTEWPVFAHLRSLGDVSNRRKAPVADRRL